MQVALLWLLFVLLLVLVFVVPGVFLIRAGLKPADESPAGALPVARIRVGAGSPIPDPRHSAARGVGSAFRIGLGALWISIPFLPLLLR